jgi:hypothetical protein
VEIVTFRDGRQWHRSEVGWNRHQLTPLTIEKVRLMVSKELSSVLVVSSALFSKLSPDKQNEVVASAGKKRLKFVPDFGTIRNKRKLIERLILGEDISVELEFNDIELSAEETAALAMVAPVIDRIRKPSGAYPWVEVTDQQQQHIDRITFGASNISRNGYSITTKQGERLWKAASAYWAGGVMPRRYSGSFSGGYSKSVYFTGNRENTTISIGCQSISRYELEAAAQHYGWEPVVPETLEEVA